MGRYASRSLLGCVIVSIASVLSAGSPDGPETALGAVAQRSHTSGAPGYPEFSVDWRVEEPPYIAAVVFSSDGSLLAAAGRDGWVRLWDTGTGEVRRVLAERHPHVDCVAFSPDGKTLATGGQDLTIRLWEVGTGALLRTVFDPNGHVTSLAFTPDSELLAGGNGGEGTGQPSGVVRVWDVQTGELARALRIEGITVKSAPSVAISPDGASLAAACGSRSARAWDLRSGRLMWRLVARGEVSSIAYTHNGGALACEVIVRTQMTVDDRTVYPEIAHVVELRRADTGALTRSFEVSLPLINGNTGLVLSPDGRTAAVGAELWDLRTGRLRAKLEGAGRAAFSPNSHMVATGGPNGRVKLWDAGSGRLVATFAASPSKAESLAFTAQGYYRVSPTPAHPIRWRVGKEVFAIEPYQSRYSRPDLVRKALSVLGAGR